MTPSAVDSLLARLERDALLFAAITAVGSVAVRGGQVDVGLGILGGGVLAFVSYRAIKGGVDTFVDLVAGAGGGGRAMDGAPTSVPRAEPVGEPAGPGVGETPPDAVRPRLPWRARPIVAAARFAGRYALLGFLAYVMITRLRLHPVGLLIGVSSVVAAVIVEAVRQLSGGDRPRGPRGRPPAS